MPDQISDNSDSRPIGVSPSDRPWYEQMTTPLDRIANYSERQRELHAPTFIDLSPDAGLPIADTYQTTQRLRIVELIISSVTAGRFRVNFGGRYFFFACQALDTVVIPFPYEVDRGIDISVTRTVAGEATWSFYIVTYTE